MLKKYKQRLKLVPIKFGSNLEERGIVCLDKHRNYLSKLTTVPWLI